MRRFLSSRLRFSRRISPDLEHLPAGLFVLARLSMFFRASRERVSGIKEGLGITTTFFTSQPDTISDSLDGKGKGHRDISE